MGWQSLKYMAVVLIFPASIAMADEEFDLDAFVSAPANEIAEPTAEPAPAPTPAPEVAPTPEPVTEPAPAITPDPSPETEPAAATPKASDDVCAFLSGRERTNCNAAFAAVKNKDAFRYTLKYFKANLGKAADPSCALKGRGPTSIKNGIKNRCTLLLNDVTDKFDSTTSQGYFIDLCANNPKNAVKKVALNLGTGGVNVDVVGRKTTVLGAFLTDDAIRPFIPKRISTEYFQLQKEYGGRVTTRTIKVKAYSKKRKKYYWKTSSGYTFVGGSKIPALNLTGMHNSNNDTDTSKPLHTTKYGSSQGCPSMKKSDDYVMRSLAAHGPSLFMAWGGKKHHPDESIYKCSAGK